MLLNLLQTATLKHYNIRFKNKTKQKKNHTKTQTPSTLMSNFTYGNILAEANGTVHKCITFPHVVITTN